MNRLIIFISIFIYFVNCNQVGRKESIYNFFDRLVEANKTGLYDSGFVTSNDVTIQKEYINGISFQPIPIYLGFVERVHIVDLKKSSTIDVEGPAFLSILGGSVKIDSVSYGQNEWVFIDFDVTKTISTLQDALILGYCDIAGNWWELLK